MLAVAFQVPQVVHHIGARRHQRKSHEGQQRGQQLVALREREGGEHRHEQQQVLDPLVHAQRLDPDACALAGVRERGLDAQCAELCTHAGTGACGHSGGAGVPDRQVGTAVAGVDEVRADRRADRLQLAAAFQVQLHAAGQHGVEQTQVQSRGLGNAAVGGRGQHDASAAQALLADPCQQVGAPGQHGDVQHHAPRDLALQHQRPAQRPPQHAQQLQRVALQQHQHRFEQRVGVGQRAVQIDHQRRQRGGRTAGCDNGRGNGGGLGEFGHGVVGRAIGRRGGASADGWSGTASVSLPISRKTVADCADPQCGPCSAPRPASVIKGTPPRRPAARSPRQAAITAD